MSSEVIAKLTIDLQSINSMKGELDTMMNDVGGSFIDRLKGELDNLLVQYPGGGPGGGRDWDSLYDCLRNMCRFLAGGGVGERAIQVIEKKMEDWARIMPIHGEYAESVRDDLRRVAEQLRSAGAIGGRMAAGAPPYPPIVTSAAIPRGAPDVGDIPFEMEEDDPSAQRLKRDIGGMVPAGVGGRPEFQDPISRGMQAMLIPDPNLVRSLDRIQANINEILAMSGSTFAFVEKYRDMAHTRLLEEMATGPSEITFSPEEMEARRKREEEVREKTGYPTAPPAGMYGLMHGDPAGTGEKPLAATLASFNQEMQAYYDRVKYFLGQLLPTEGVPEMEMSPWLPEKMPFLARKQREMEWEPGLKKEARGKRGRPVWRGPQGFLELLEMMTEAGEEQPEPEWWTTEQGIQDQILRALRGGIKYAPKEVRERRIREFEEFALRGEGGGAIGRQAGEFMSILGKMSVEMRREVLSVLDRLGARMGPTEGGKLIGAGTEDWNKMMGLLNRIVTLIETKEVKRVVAYASTIKAEETVSDPSNPVVPAFAEEMEKGVAE